MQLITTSSTSKLRYVFVLCLSSTTTVCYSLSDFRSMQDIWTNQEIVNRLWGGVPPPWRSFAMIRLRESFRLLCYRVVSLGVSNENLERVGRRNEG
jgi:hypothetical protein